MGDRRLMESRSWRWFAAKVEGVLAKPPIGFVQVEDPADDRKVVNRPLYATRLQTHFYSAS